MKKYVDKDKLQEFTTKLTGKYKQMFSSPLVASTVADMTDEEKVYVYVGSETGYTNGNWYYYDGSDWVSGGVYNAVAVETDDTLLVQGKAADSKAVGDAIDEVKADLEQLQGGGLTADVKEALLACIAHIGIWDDDNGQDYYDALESALYASASLVSISAVYTQSGTVYDTDTLDSLKTDLVVTASYSDSSTEIVNAYTLSGTLATGTSVITVLYGGKTTTFNVTVTHDTRGYITDGLFAHWDAIDNQATGEHSSNATTWIDKVNGHTWTAMVTGSSKSWSWGDNYLSLNPARMGDVTTNGSNNFTCPRPTTGLRTLEIVMSGTETGCVGEFTSDLTGITDNTVQSVGIIATDNTFTAQGSQNGYSVTSLSNIKSISAIYDSSYGNMKAYMNGVEVTNRGSTHSFTKHGNTDMVLGSQNNATGYPYPFKGTIHAIRFYSKELTADEVAQNYAVDVTRFGLGA